MSSHSALIDVNDLRTRRGDARLVRVMLVEPHAAMRRSLRAVLEDAGMLVVAEPLTVSELELELRCADPQVVVLDMSDRSGTTLQTIRALRAAEPGVAVIATTLHEMPGFEAAVLASGASALVRKDVADSALPLAVSAAVAA
jgi:DNA-binding NarL/FixJ family response regulator